MVTAQEIMIELRRGRDGGEGELAVGSGGGLRCLVA